LQLPHEHCALLPFACLYHLQQLVLEVRDTVMQVSAIARHLLANAAVGLREQVCRRLSAVCKV
jgi:hypothetical protein